MAPRALEDSVRPRRLSGVVVRPLNFTVRSHLGETHSCEEQGARPFGAAVCELQLTGSSCRRLRSAHPSGVRRYAIKAGARAEHVVFRPKCELAPRPQGTQVPLFEGWARLTRRLCCLRLPVGRRTRTVVICEGDF